ncbi:MAG: hypothetical protein AAGH15_08750 [Myxococcota bacterium]
MTCALCVDGPCAAEADEIRVLTFAIDGYPAGNRPRQEEGAFEAMRRSEAALVAVQGIRDVPRFERAAKRHLGPNVRFVADEGTDRRHVGVLYHSELFALEGAKEHRIGNRVPLLEVRLAQRGRSTRVRLFVFLGFFQWLSDTTKAEMARVLRDAPRSDETVLLLGQFHLSRDPEDHLDALAEASDLEWLSRDLRCTGFLCSNYDCVASFGAHVLGNRPAEVEAGAHCASTRCERCVPWTDSCPPPFVREVSSSCPLLVTIPREE